MQDTRRDHRLKNSKWKRKNAMIYLSDSLCYAKIKKSSRRLKCLDEITPKKQHSLPHIPTLKLVVCPHEGASVMSPRLGVLERRAACSDADSGRNHVED